MKRLLALALLAAPAAAQDKPAALTPTSIVAAAPKSEWKAIDPADLLVMTLTPDAAGQPRTVVTQLIPPPFSQGWVGNIRALAKAHWWDGTSVYRVVDNWVTQWGNGEDDEAKPKKLPDRLRVVPESEYAINLRDDMPLMEKVASLLPAQADRLMELSRNRTGTGTGYKADSYAALTLVWGGWPVGIENGLAWPTHCYSYIGVARDLESTGTGAELYAVIGQAPRQLDRNIAVVGRVIEGMENLSALPRGKGEAGVYDDPKLRVPILSVRLGNELPQPPRFEYLGTDTASFARYLQVSANRSDPFYKVAAGGIDICNAKVPIRRAKP